MIGRGSIRSKTRSHNKKKASSKRNKPDEFFTREPDNHRDTKHTPAAAGSRASRIPKRHQTVDRVTRILEEVVFNPGLTLAEVAGALDAPKSPVHGFVDGLRANGWLLAEKGRYYLGPAVYGVTLASGHIRAGLVTEEDLAALHEEARVPVFLGVQAGDDLIYIAQSGSDPIAGFKAPSNFRRRLLYTAGGKALVAAKSDKDREVYLRRRPRDETEQVQKFLEELEGTRRTRVAMNLRESGTRLAIATAVRNHDGEPVASVTLVGPADAIRRRLAKLIEILLRHVNSWPKRNVIRPKVR